jgi:hypothetical protein
MDGKPSSVPNVSYRAWLRGAVIADLQVTASRALADPLLRQNKRPVHQHEGFLSFVSNLMRRTDHNRNRVSTSLAQTNLLQPHNRHSVLIRRLP